MSNEHSDAREPGSMRIVTLLGHDALDLPFIVVAPGDERLLLARIPEASSQSAHVLKGELEAKLHGQYTAPHTPPLAASVQIEVDLNGWIAVNVVTSAELTAAFKELMALPAGNRPLMALQNMEDRLQGIVSGLKSILHAQPGDRMPLWVSAIPAVLQADSISPTGPQDTASATVSPARHPRPEKLPIVAFRATAKVMEVAAWRMPPHNDIDREAIYPVPGWALALLVDAASNGSELKLTPGHYVIWDQKEPLDKNDPWSGISILSPAKFHEMYAITEDGPSEV